VKSKERKGRRRRLKGKAGRGTLEKERPPVFGMMQRGGQVVINLMANVKQKTIEPLVMFQICTFTECMPYWPYLLKGSSMVLIPVRCPYCHSDDIIKGGKTDTGKQRYRCQNAACPHRSFLLNPAYKGRLPEIKQQIVDMGLNGSGIRDTARVLQISPTTVVNELKKKGLHSKP
jgi:transposase-like protein